jgi:hypothetical protein
VNALRELLEREILLQQLQRHVGVERVAHGLL